MCPPLRADEHDPPRGSEAIHTGSDARQAYIQGGELRKVHYPGRSADAAALASNAPRHAPVGGRRGHLQSGEVLSGRVEGDAGEAYIHPVRVGPEGVHRAELHHGGS